MKPATFAALAAITVAVAGGAYWATQQREAVIADPWERTALYPGIEERLNDVTGVRINTQADGTLTMSKGERGWILAEKYGYAADFDKVRQTLVELSSMETLEPKTSKPENYPELAVEAVGEQGGKPTSSTHVTVSAGSEAVADLIVGRTRPKDVGAGVFVRKNGEDRAWLATGSYQPNTRAIQWLDRNVVNIDSRRIRHVRMMHADGDNFEVEKPDIASEDMAYASPVPEGLEAKPVHEMNNMASVTDFLILEDVRPASEVDWTAGPVVSTYETYDGLNLTFTAVRFEGKVWVRGQAEAVPLDERIAAFVEEHKGKDSAQGRMADEMKSADAVTAEIQEINERLSGWAYQLTDYKSGKVTQRSEDMLQAPKAGG